MAAKVNKQVVFGLVGGIVCVVAAVVFLMTFVFKSGAELAARGDKLMSEGKYEEASLAYSKAVNKEQNKVEYYRKWAEALSKLEPSNLQAYSDRFRQWYETQRSIATVLRTDVDAHKVVLDMRVRDARTTPPDRAGPLWQSLESEADDLIARMSKESQEKADQMRRYRGIGTAAKSGLSLEVSAADRQRAREDLLAAMKANPSDAMAMAFYAELMRTTADKESATNNLEKAAELLAEAKAVVDDFCARNPTSTHARLAKLQMETAELSARARLDPKLYDELNAVIKPGVEQLLMTLESEDPLRVDDMVAVNVMDVALQSQTENAAERGLAIYDRLVAARPTEPVLQLMRGRFLARINRHDEAVEQFSRLSAMPNMPVSPNGIALFGMRDQAMVLRAESLISKAGQAKNKEELDPAVKRAKAGRDDVRARASIDEKAKLLLDARIALLERDTAEARKLLANYNQLSNYSDAQAMLLLAQVLNSQGLKGEAKQLLVRIVDMRQGNLEIYRFLAALDLELNNLTSARNWIEQGLSMSPADEGLLKMASRLKEFMNPEQSGDPFVVAVGQARAVLTQSPPDKVKGMELLRSAARLCRKPEDYLSIMQMMAAIDRAEAAQLGTRALALFPENDTLKRLVPALNVADPYAEMVGRIDSNKDASEIDKTLQLFLLASNFGRVEDAIKHLDKAASMDPDHPVVVAGQFERLLTEYERSRDAAVLEKVRALVKKATDKNLDKVDGRVYQGRLLAVEGRLNEAVPLLQRATEIDALNPISWRYLASLYVATGDLGRGLRAIDRSLQIKPDEVASIVVRLRILTALERIPEALSAAREASRMGIQDPVFVHLWLILEFRSGDKDLAIERRAWILRNQPDNMENALAHARDLLQLGRVDDAQKVITLVEGKPNVEPTLTMLRAAVRGARGETEAALAEFEKMIEALSTNDRIPKESLLQAQEGTAMEIADLLNTLGRRELVIDLLNRSRKYQTGESARIDRMLGDVLFGQGQWGPAREAYARAREASRDDTDNLLLKRIIECHMKAREFDQARALIDKQGGDQTRDVQLLLLSAQLEAARGDRAKSLQLLDRAVDVAPNNPLTYRQRGVERSNDPRTLEDAVTDFKQAIGMDRNDPDLVILLSRAQIKQGLPVAAVDTLERGLNVLTDDENLRYELVQLQFALGRTREAFAALAKARAAQPRNMRWLLLEGILHQRANDQASAVRLYDEAWQANRSPEIGKALVDAIMAQYDVGAAKTPPEKDTALLSRARAVVDAPEFGADRLVPSRMTRATLNLRSGQTAAAAADLKAVFSDTAFSLSDPQFGTFVIDELRRVYGGSMPKVLEIIEAQRPADGWPEPFMLLLARSMMNDRNDAGLRERGYAAMDALMKSSTKAIAVGAASTKGVNKFLDKKHEDAVAAFQVGLSLDPDNAELNNNMAYVLSKGLSRHAEALPRALKAVEKDPNNPSMLDTLGVIYMSTNDLDRAEATLDRARSVANDGVSRTMPTVHLIEVKLKKNDRIATEGLMRELDTLLANEPRVKATYGNDIEEIRKTIKATP